MSIVIVIVIVIMVIVATSSARTVMGLFRIIIHRLVPLLILLMAIGFLARTMVTSSLVLLMISDLVSPAVRKTSITKT